MNGTQQRPILKSLDDLHSFLVSELRRPDRAVTFFVGAGISKPPPSNLPSSANVIKHVTEALCMGHGVDIYERNLPDRVLEADMKMEVLFELIQRSIGSRLKALFSMFEGDAPNLYHHFLARLLEANYVKYIVTTNFDQLIEKASRVDLNILATEAEFIGPPNRSLFKIHGTVDRPETIIAVLSQVSRGLSPNKRQLLKEALGKTCVVVGWSNDDIDLTPSFSENDNGSLIWFHYAPHSQQITDFLATPRLENIPEINPKIQLILQKRHGILVACNPVAFFLNIWRSLEQELGWIPTLERESHIDAVSIARRWRGSLTLADRLSIVGDILRHLASWSEASSLFQQAEAELTDPHQLYYFHYRLGLCAIHLSHWQDAFRYLHLALKEKGYQLAIEDFLDDCPGDPELAVLYGNLGLLLEKIGRLQDAVKCYAMDMALCERFRLAGGSQACSNLASGLGILGKHEEAKRMAEKGIAWGLEEGNIHAIRDGRLVLASLAAVRGDWAEVETELKQALEIVEMIGQPDYQVYALMNLAQHCCTIGEIEAAHRYANRALEIAEYYGLRNLQAEVWMIVGVICKEEAVFQQSVLHLSNTHLFHDSLEAYSKSLKLIGSDHSNDKLRSMILTNRGLLHYLLKDYQKAFYDLWESLQLRTQLLDEIGRAHILDNLALVFLKGRMAANEAEGFLREALSVYERFGYILGQCQVLNDLGAVYATRLYMLDQMSHVHQAESKDLYQQAKKFYERSLALAKQLDVPSKIKQAEQNLKILTRLYAEVFSD